MKVSRQLALVMILLALLLAAGCTHKKKPKLPVQAHAPTLSVPLPDEIAEATPLPEASQPKQEEPPAPVAKPKSSRHRNNAHKPAQPPQPPVTSQSPPTPPNGGMVASARPPANPAAESGDLGIAADLTRQQLNQQKQTTTQLLETTEKNLKTLNRSLSHDEEAMVTQIRSYVAQSHKATTDGDFERAYNLAVKAQLLSDALSKK